MLVLDRFRVNFSVEEIEGERQREKVNPRKSEKDTYREREREG